MDGLDLTQAQALATIRTMYNNIKNGRSAQQQQTTGGDDDGNDGDDNEDEEGEDEDDDDHDEGYSSSWSQIPFKFLLSPIP